jgi:iron complex outermembrane receptor protein
VPTLVLPEAVTVIRNTGELSSYGIEAELSARPLKGLELSYAFGYTHATYNSLLIAQNGAEVDLRGKRQLFTPEVTSLLAAQYGFPVYAPKGIRLFVRGEWKYLGRQYFDLANTLTQAPYQLFHLSAGIEAGRVSLTAWSRNLGDTRFISYAYDFGTVHLGDPRTWGITLKAAF